MKRLYAIAGLGLQVFFAACSQDRAPEIDARSEAADVTAQDGILGDGSLPTIACLSTLLPSTPLAIAVSVSPPKGMRLILTVVRADGLRLARVSYFVWDTIASPDPAWGGLTRIVAQIDGEVDLTTSTQIWSAAALSASRFFALDAYVVDGKTALNQFQFATGTWDPSIPLPGFEAISNGYASSEALAVSSDRWAVVGLDAVAIGAKNLEHVLPVPKAADLPRRIAATFSDGFLAARILESGGLELRRIRVDGTSTAVFHSTDALRVDAVAIGQSDNVLDAIGWDFAEGDVARARHWVADLSTGAAFEQEIPFALPPATTSVLEGSKLRLLPGGILVTDAIESGRLHRFALDGSPILPGTGSEPPGWLADEYRQWATADQRVAFVGYDKVWWTDAFGNLGCEASGPCATMDPRSCADGNPCTADGCDAAHGGCWNEPVPDGYICGDNGVCKGGFCQQ